MEDYSGLADFKLHLIETITDNFSDDKKVGSGGYGDVYKAEHDGKEIAVKKLHPFQGLADKQFHSEVQNLVNIRHENVVRLIGYCYETRHHYIEHNKELVFAKTMERVICFEYMQGGSLDKHIADEPCRIGWSTCYGIIKGTCKGLNHLHNAQEKPIYHLDLKPGNILLDKRMMPKIGDLGLFKLIASTETHKTEMLKGTNGYMPPEYINNGYVSKKFDVFSLGVIILRMMAGNKGYFSCSTIPPTQFIDLVTENWKERLQAASKDLSPEMDILRVRKCVEIALRCVDTERKNRPTIQDIVRELEELEADIKKIMLAKDAEKDRSVSLLGGTKRIMHFNLHTIRTITNNFAEEQTVGRGGFGHVYRATHEGEVIAVKKLHYLEGLDDMEFNSEFLNLINVRHQNVVRLIGYCDESSRQYMHYNGKLVNAYTMERVLCFEFMHGGSLDKYIQDESCGLDWPTCYKIIKGTCEGLNHLHNSQAEPIFHLNLKPGKILLDESMTPKIGHLDLSRLVASAKTRQTEMPVGTLGFMPPEYVNSGLISKKFDVFSLGVIIIKLLAGNTNYFWCFEMPPGKFVELVSENWTKRKQAKPGYSSHEIDILGVTTCVEIALRCVDVDRKKRPSIEDIIHELEELEAKIKEMALTFDQSKDLILHKSGDTNALTVDPSVELCFPFEPRKEVSCCVQLTNTTDDSVAFNMTIDRNKYRTGPSQGTIPPRSRRYVVVTLRAQEPGPPNMRCYDMLLVQSIRVGQDEVAFQGLFERAMSETVTLPIAYVAATDQ